MTLGSCRSREVLDLGMWNYPDAFEACRPSCRRERWDEDAVQVGLNVAMCQRVVSINHEMIRNS